VCYVSVSDVCLYSCLCSGCIRRVHSQSVQSQQTDGIIVQVLEVKKIEPKAGQSGERYRSAAARADSRRHMHRARLSADRLVLSVRLLPLPRLVISDGEYYIQVSTVAACLLCRPLCQLCAYTHLFLRCCFTSLLQGMLATQLNEQVTSGQLTTNSIVRLNEYICNDINGKKSVACSNNQLGD